MPCRTTGALRIIGGDWRGRKFTLFVARPCVPAVTGCGNPCSIVWGNAWMVCVVWIFLPVGGALGLEAASRGAGAVTLVEKNRRSARSREAAIFLGATQVRVLMISAEDFLADELEPFDMIFLDPPFAEYGAPLAWRRLLKAAGGLSAVGGRIYAEGGIDIPEPSGWKTEKQSLVGAVRWRIFSRRLT